MSLDKLQIFTNKFNSDPMIFLLKFICFNLPFQGHVLKSIDQIMSMEC